MAEPQSETTELYVDQSSYPAELARICNLLEGPVCQIGARAEVIDAKRLNWRRRLQGKRFIGIDVTPGENVEVVLDICDDFAHVQAAISRSLGGERPRTIICAHLLEHLPRPWVAARNIETLLAPSGQLFLQVPWVQAYHPHPDDYWRISLSGLKELFPGLELCDAFYSGGSSDVAYRVLRAGRPDFSPAAGLAEARVFQVLLSPEANRELLRSLPEQRAYLSRGYLPAMVLNVLARKPAGPRPESSADAKHASPVSAARHCSICGYVGAFKAHPRSGRANASCPRCKAKERHRMLALFLRQGGTDRLAGKRVLHFSPESLLVPFAARATAYETADPFMQDVDHRVDITRIALPDAQYDVVLCNHVLEHVEDDHAALRELRRILRPGGIAVITVPVIEGWEKTYENPAIVSPEARELHFGRHDHVRYYGRDLRDRIVAAGFELEVFQPTPEECVTYAITRGHSVFVGHRR